MAADTTLRYIHYPLNEEITAIGGHYVVTGEYRIPFGDREILYVTGYAIMDTTCCGMGGCGYALVYGYVEQWRHTTEDEGYAVSRVIPVREETERDELRRMIDERESVMQINFM